MTTLTDQERGRLIVALRNIAQRLRETNNEGLAQLTYYIAALLERGETLSEDVAHDAITHGEVDA